MRRGLLTRFGHAGDRADLARLLGVFAILIQAILFAWHTHPLPLAGVPGTTIVVSRDAQLPLQPAAAEDECEICFALHHHGAAPVEMAAAQPPQALPAPAARAEAAELDPGPFRLFRSRAPPIAEISAP